MLVQRQELDAASDLRTCACRRSLAYIVTHVIGGTCGVRAQLTTSDPRTVPASGSLIGLNHGLQLRDLVRALT
jgi:hypothetical protein